MRLEKYKYTVWKDGMYFNALANFNTISECEAYIAGYCDSANIPREALFWKCNKEYMIVYTKNNSHVAYSEKYSAEDFASAEQKFFKNHTSAEVTIQMIFDVTED